MAEPVAKTLDTAPKDPQWHCELRGLWGFETLSAWGGGRGAGDWKVSNLCCPTLSPKPRAALQPEEPALVLGHTLPFSLTIHVRNARTWEGRRGGGGKEPRSMPSPRLL